MSDSNSARQLLGIIKGYRGDCDECGAEIYEPTLLVSELHEKDAYGNRLLLVIGIPDDDDVRFGKHLRCKVCGNLKLIIRLYEQADITEFLAKHEAKL